MHLSLSVGKVYLCTRRKLAVVCLLTLAMVSSVPAEGADWDHWRGPTRNDVSAEPSGWDGKTWIKGKLWCASVGEGSSSPLVVGNRVYLTGWSDITTRFIAWMRTAAKKCGVDLQVTTLWSLAVGDQYLYSGTCSTPEYDSQTGLLFTLGVDGDLNAWNTRKKGQRAWTLNLYDRYQAPRRPKLPNAERRSVTTVTRVRRCGRRSADCRSRWKERQSYRLRQTRWT